ncbi:MAG TPA: EamA family transporter, partial [Micromonosporaceae bacterium]
MGTPVSLRAVAPGVVGMILVGSSVGISHTLIHAPLFAAQGIRYAGAFVLMVGFAKLSHARIVRPRGSEWLWLAGIAAAGLVLFNVA